MHLCAIVHITSPFFPTSISRREACPRGLGVHPEGTNFELLQELDGINLIFPRSYSVVDEDYDDSEFLSTA